MTELADDDVRSFKSSRWWSFNIWGATVAGFGTGMLVSTLDVIGAVNSTPKSEPLRIALVICGLVMLAVLAYFPGNAIARHPYEVVIEKGKGLRVYAPFKKLYIPIENIRDVGFSGEGSVVRLKRRHWLLKVIVIHRFFGSQGPPLADAIREEIQRYTS
jgi:hypothetical protein